MFVMYLDCISEKFLMGYCLLEKWLSPLRPAAVGRAYMLRKKEATTFAVVDMGTLFQFQSHFVYWLIQLPLIHLYIHDLPCKWILRIRRHKPMMDSSYPMTLELSVLFLINCFNHCWWDSFPWSSNSIWLIKLWCHFGNELVVYIWVKIDCDDAKVILRDEQGREICFMDK